MVPVTSTNKEQKVIVPTKRDLHWKQPQKYVYKNCFIPNNGIAY